MKKVLLAIALLPAIAPAQSTGSYRGPIIDVHLHAHTRESLAQPVPNPATGEMSPKTAEEHMTRSLQIMKDRNVVLGIVSGSSIDDVEAWDAAAPDRIMTGISVDDPTKFMSPEDLDRLFREKKLDAFGEVAAQYQATLPRIRPSIRIGRWRRSMACRWASTPAVGRRERRIPVVRSFACDLGIRFCSKTCSSSIRN